MFISFIIPLYNCEKYISQCLDSILLCHFPNDMYEIIIINDGSKDNGPTICNKYIEKYNQIKLISQQNQGASAARNIGMEIAQGEYIWFVDGDDQIIPSFLDRAYRLLKEGSYDMLCFNHEKLYTDNRVKIEEFKYRYSCSGLDFLKGHYTKFIWNKIYKRSVIYNYRFLHGTKTIEDMLFNMFSIINMKHVLCLPEYGYLYNCTNIFSTTRNQNLRNLVKTDLDSVIVLSELKTFADNNVDQEKHDVLMEQLYFTITGHLYNLFKFYSPKRLKKRITEYKNKGLYPIKRSYNKKGNFFLLLANNESIFVNTMRLIVAIKR